MLFMFVSAFPFDFFLICFKGVEDLGPKFELAVGKRSENHLQIVGKSMDFLSEETWNQGS